VGGGGEEGIFQIVSQTQRRSYLKSRCQEIENHFLVKKKQGKYWIKFENFCVELSFLHFYQLSTKWVCDVWCVALYQEQAVFGKMKMDPVKRAQTQNAGENSSL
jgi:hypothetical protein